MRKYLCLIENIKCLQAHSECNGMPRIVKKRSEIVCRKCGLIISDREFDIFQKKIKRWSPEAPISYLFTDIGLNTLINNKKIHRNNFTRYQ